MRRSLKSTEAEEALRGSRVAAWLPEAEWEWDDRVPSNLWPCELLPDRREGPAPPASPKVSHPETEDLSPT